MSARCGWLVLIAGFLRSPCQRRRPRSGVRRPPCSTRARRARRCSWCARPGQLRAVATTDGDSPRMTQLAKLTETCLPLVTGSQPVFLPATALGTSATLLIPGRGGILLCPLTLKDRPAAHRGAGRLRRAAAAGRPVGDARDPGQQAALAVERVTLTQEVIRQRSQAYFRTLVQNTSDVILIVGDDGWSGTPPRRPPASSATSRSRAPTSGTWSTGRGRDVARVLDLMRPASPAARTDLLDCGSPAGTAGRPAPGPVQRPAGRPDRRRPGAHLARRHRAAPA